MMRMRRRRIRKIGSSKEEYQKWGGIFRGRKHENLMEGRT